MHGERTGIQATKISTDLEEVRKHQEQTYLLNEVEKKYPKNSVCYEIFLKMSEFT